MDHGKVREELNFYFATGAVLYFVNLLLYVIHIQQTKGFAPVDLGFLILFFIINLVVISHIRKFKNWARSIFIVRFIVLALALYPYYFFPTSGWVYSSHWPHGALQRISNYANITYEVFFMLYLLKPSTRFAFAHP